MRVDLSKQRWFNTIKLYTHAGNSKQIWITFKILEHWCSENITPKLVCFMCRCVNVQVVGSKKLDTFVPKPRLLKFCKFTSPPACSHLILLCMRIHSASQAVVEHSALLSWFRKSVLGGPSILGNIFIFIQQETVIPASFVAVKFNRDQHKIEVTK